MRQLEILRREVERLRQDPVVLGVMLTGSFAVGCAAPESDLDLYVLCGEERFAADWVEGVLVETSFTTPASARAKLRAAPMETYRWQDAKLLYDPQGLLAGLALEARQAYETYAPPEALRRRLAHWLVSLDLKLSAALAIGDLLKGSYLASTNAWILLEAMWTANGRPIPPSGTAYRAYGQLAHFPCATWFRDLFEGTTEQRAAHARSMIAWLVPRLKGELE